MGSAERLFGRDHELELLRHFVERASVRGEALLLLGDPGVGKTALLDDLEEIAASAGVRVLRAAGIEFKADMSYAALNQMLLPLYEDIADLSPPQRDALNIALGFAEGTPPDRLLVANAALVLLRASATARPLLVIVDDLQWLDRASAAALGFVSRRLGGSRVGFLAGLRAGEESLFERAGLPEYVLEPLDHDAARGLLTDQFPGLASRVQERIIDEAEGNPLALLELPAGLSGSQRAAVAALPAILPLGQRLEALFAARVTQLPDSARELLLLAALDGTGDLRILQAGLTGQHNLQDWEAIEDARLARIETGAHRIVFAHSLIRTAVVELSRVEERRRAHRSLAELFTDQPDRRAHHLAAATTAPDEEVAALVEQAAHRILKRGDAVGAVATLIRSSELSPCASDRSRRLAEAAYFGADVTGELRNAALLLSEARRSDPEIGGSLQAAVAAAYVLLNTDGDVDNAHRLLVGAINNQLDAGGDGGGALEEALHTLMMVCFFGGRADRWKPFYDAITRLGPHVPTPLYLASKTFSDPVRTGREALPLLETTINGIADELDPARIVRIGFASVFADRVGDCRGALQRVVRDARDGGAVGSGIQAMTVLGWDDFWTGRWDEALKVAAEGLKLCDAHGFVILSWPFRLVQALHAAASGDAGAAQALTDQMIQWATARKVRFVQLNAWQALTLDALGRGDFEEAYIQANKISPAGEFPSHVLHALYVLFDLVEAAVRTGRDAEAAAHVRAMHDAQIGALSSRLALLAGGATAVASGNRDALELFEQALAHPGVERWPFDLARVRLAYGERLRRHGAGTESRIQLTAALEAFERLGARPWADRAANELRATGQTRPRLDDRARGTLNRQEREIASLAAAGLTNREIAERLFLSPRTIGAHLYRIFPKLGITSRSALRDALNRLPREEHDPTEVAP
jgi:DNA-binding CsgD family transcriptional regulator